MALDEVVVARDHKRIPTRGDVFFISRKDNYLDESDAAKLEGASFQFRVGTRDMGYWKVQDVRVVQSGMHSPGGGFVQSMADEMELACKQVYPKGYGD